MSNSFPSSFLFLGGFMDETLKPCLSHSVYGVEAIGRAGNST